MPNFTMRVVSLAAGVAFAAGAATSAHATEPTPKWCEGVKIAFPGGPQGGAFAKQAAIHAVCRRTGCRRRSSKTRRVCERRFARRAAPT